MPGSKIKNYLDTHKIAYEIIQHGAAYTASEIAAAAHIPGKSLAKTVIVKIDDTLVMAVLPASYRINFDRLKEIAHANKVALAKEEEFKDRFPECETGAMPPFGGLYGLDVFVAESLPREGAIAFSAGSHTELIRLAYADFEKLVKPTRAPFSWMP